jgi:hypothetical protein
MPVAGGNHHLSFEIVRKWLGTMAEVHLDLLVLKETFAVCRLAADADVPAWAWKGPFVSVTRTPDETSLVCLSDQAPPGVTAERSWRCIKVEGPLAFTQVGLLASLLNPLSLANISIFAVSTYDTDYLLIKEHDLEAAVSVLMQAGHLIGRQGG